MLTPILSRSTCASCRICCFFDKTDCWEMPLFTPPTAEIVEKNYPNVKLTKLNDKAACKSLSPEFDSEGLCRCPLLTDKGCALGEQKPFDCRIWPFRVMRKGDVLLLTLSPVCPSVSALSVAKVSEFSKKIAAEIFAVAEKYPELVKDYIEGYPVFAVK